MQTGVGCSTGPNKARLASLAAAGALLFAACGSGQADTADVAAGASLAEADSAAAPAAAAPTIDEAAATTPPVTAAPAESAAEGDAAPDEPTSAPATAALEEPTPQDEAPVVEVDDATAEATADSNLATIRDQESTGLPDFQVLDVATGSISTLQGAVTGDRPVLLWFFSPH